MKKLAILLVFLSSVLFFAFIAKERSVMSGEDLIRKIYQTHSQNWYPYFTWKQDMFRYRDDSLVRNEIWVLAYSAPSKLHIRYKDFDSGRGWIINSDTLFSFNHDKLIGKKYNQHELMTLGLDVYIVSPDIILPKLASMNFDLSVFSETIIKGKPVYQVGDPEKLCFWVHKSDLLFYGIRKVGDLGTRETFFENYKSFYGMPVATEIQYFQDGKIYLFEKYFEIRLPSTLPDIYFDAENFKNVRW